MVKIKKANHYIEFNMSSFLPNFDTDLKDYYRYSGSLTTPPCSEGVVWTVFRQYLNISARQLEIIRGLKLQFNHRSPQSLFKRKVYSSFKANNVEYSTVDFVSIISRLKNFFRNLFKKIFY